MTTPHLEFKRFDSLSRYRLAALILILPFILVQVDWTTDHQLARITFWIGLAWLWISLAWDTWKVYTGKRKVHRMIEHKLHPHKKM